MSMLTLLLLFLTVHLGAFLALLGVGLAVRATGGVFVLVAVSGDTYRASRAYPGGAW